MEKGTDTVMVALYLNDAQLPAATKAFPVNVNANAYKLAIGHLSGKSPDFFYTGNHWTTVSRGQ